MTLKKTLIVGAAKSGTTALYFNIKNSLPKNIICLFEPKKFVKDNYNLNQVILAKILLSPECNYESFMSFENKIFISRDPRDRIISELLYVIGFHFHEMKIDESSLVDFYNLLKIKEKNSSEVSFKDLFYHSEKIQQFLLKGYKKSLEFISLYEDFFLLKYEDFCMDNNIDLQNYLTIKLSNNKNVDNEYSRVVRTKSFGGWKDWFTEDDIVFFKPLFNDYMKEFNYDSTIWNLNKTQSVLSQHGSSYFLNLLNQRRKGLRMRSLEV